MNILTLINAANIFNQVAQTKISSKTAYKIMKLYKSIAAEEEFYNQKRNDIINQYADRDENGQIKLSEDGNMIIILPDKLAEAELAMLELNNIEVEIPNIRFNLSELEELKFSV
jgi:hypothetical protein